MKATTTAYGRQIAELLDTGNVDAAYILATELKTRIELRMTNKRTGRRAWLEVCAAITYIEDCC